ncbi:hypothetical protein K456DRAFT_490409 [Colletotrichum gloeosporioides 23]|nr:hypothetical protein K456DRAFT_490409 [Colletotrichum gloeosporioides 23]
MQVNRCQAAYFVSFPRWDRAIHPVHLLPVRSPFLLFCFSSFSLATRRSIYRGPLLGCIFMGRPRGTDRRTYLYPCIVSWPIIWPYSCEMRTGMIRNLMCRPLLWATSAPAAVPDPRDRGKRRKGREGNSPRRYPSRCDIARDGLRAS